jgi:hypothetical protein
MQGVLMMLSLFAFPKPFRGHIATIQRNAIGSWVRLRPLCEVFLFGDEEGTAEVAKEFDACHVSGMARNEYGTPLLSDVFEKGEQLAKHGLLCYVNCDIILGSEFMRAVEHVSHSTQRFLIVGECWNLDLPEPLAFDQPRWEESLKTLVRQRGKLRGPLAIDYFVFPRGLYQQLPPFALGRPRFDNWLIWKARHLGAAVVDATPVVMAVHQNHDYSHVPGGLPPHIFLGEEAIRNEKLAGGSGHCIGIGIEEATHKFLATGLRRNWAGYLMLKRRWRRVTRGIGTFFWRVMDLTRSPRHALGLHIGNMKRFKALMTGQR